jgi:hypothetical protein
MKQKQIFREEELPMEKLAKVGINGEKLRYMPADMRSALLGGRVTPFFQASVVLADGRVIVMPMKAQLVRDEKDNVLLMTYPMRKELSNDLNLSPMELEKVKNGGVVRKEVSDQYGRRLAFVQLDRETRSMMYRSIGSVSIEEQLRSQEKVRDIELGPNQKQAILTGKPVELEVGDTMVTVGVDLRQPEGFKVVNGDMQEWDRQQKIRYDDSREDFMGYVMTDENRWEYRKVAERQNVRTEREQKLTGRKQQGMKI